MHITNVSLVTVWVTDQDVARDWFVDVLGFVATQDVTMGDGFRWVSVAHPEHPELEITLMVPGPPMSDDMAAAIRRELASGGLGGLGLATDDCHAAYEDLRAKGVEFVQPPAERPYGVEAVLRDPMGNWYVLVERRPFGGPEVDAPTADAART